MQVVMGEGCYPHVIFKILPVLLHREFAKIVLYNVFYVKKNMGWGGRFWKYFTHDYCVGSMKRQDPCALKCTHSNSACAMSSTRKTLHTYTFSKLSTRVGRVGCSRAVANITVEGGVASMIQTMTLTAGLGEPSDGGTASRAQPLLDFQSPGGQSVP